MLWVDGDGGRGHYKRSVVTSGSDMTWQPQPLPPVNVVIACPGNPWYGLYVTVHIRRRSSLSFCITRRGNSIRNRPVCVRNHPLGLWDWESRSWWPSGQRKCHSLTPSISLVLEQKTWFWSVTDSSALMLFVVLIILAESYSLVATRALTGVIMAGDYLTVKQDIVWV